MTDVYWSQTYSGKAFYYGDDAIAGNVYALEDIAHQLATINRYGGAAIYPYSVAQHSCALATAVWDATLDPKLCLDALFHDAAEAYMGDLRTPLKDRCPEFRVMEAPIDEALRRAMRAKGILVPEHESDIVKSYDRRLVANEREFVMQPCEQDWYGMKDKERIPGLSAVLFEEQGWRIAKLRWRKLVETFNVLAKQAEAAEKLD